jgi:hypothetical protein
MTKTDFFCKTCGDVTLISYRNGNRWANWYEGKCKCGIILIRYITDKKFDPYYYYSPRMRYERDRMKKDLIQPGEEGFKTHYKKQWDKMEEDKESAELKEKKEKESRDEFYKKYKSPATMKAIEAEEKLNA